MAPPLYWTKERIIAAIHEHAEQNGGEPPAAFQWSRAMPHRPCASNVLYQFGSWNAAITAAGLRPRPKGRMPKRWTEQQIIEAIQRWVDQHGQTPRCSDWRRNGHRRPCASSVVWTFGSWNAAIAAAGFDPRPEPSNLIKEAA